MPGSARERNKQDVTSELSEAFTPEELETILSDWDSLSDREPGEVSPVTDDTPEPEIEEDPEDWPHWPKKDSFDRGEL